MIRKMIIVLALTLVVVAGTVAYVVLRPPADASQPIEAIPLETVADETPSQSALTTGGTEAVDTPVASAEQTTISADTSTAEDVASAPSTLVAEPTLFEIVSEESEARFIIDEVLNGSPKTVVGVTDQVAGQIAVNASSPADTQIGVIQVNARTLSTDSDMRNRAIKNSILDTNGYEYITFTPVDLVGLPDAVTVGEPFTFQIVGDLTVRDMTQQVAFEVQMTPVSESELSGSTSTTIRYADFGISIPQVPSVTGVEEEVTLEIDFVAQSA